MTMPNNLLIEEIRKHRKLSGVSQRDIAEMLKMPSSTYAQKEREGSFKNEELANIAKLLKIKDKILLELAARGDGQSLSYDEVLLRILAVNNVTLRTLAKLTAKADARSERITLSHLFDEVELEKKELEKEFSIAKDLKTYANHLSRPGLPQ